ncbi:MAG: hypothetical protein GY861_16110 [bacterium]|nr:hypothetical protein [bacterium]
MNINKYFAILLLALLVGDVINLEGNYVHKQNGQDVQNVQNAQNGQSGVSSDDAFGGSLFNDDNGSTNGSTTNGSTNGSTNGFTNGDSNGSSGTNGFTNGDSNGFDDKDNGFDNGFDNGSDNGMDNGTEHAETNDGPGNNVEGSINLTEPENLSKEEQGPLTSADNQRKNGVGLPHRCFRKGNTWVKVRHDCRTFVDYINCWGPVRNDNNSFFCNPWTGDTFCWRRRRVLCHNPNIKLNRPSYPVWSVPGPRPDAFYQGWTGSFIRQTRRVRGCAFTNVSQVNDFCKRSFGCGFRVLNFDDGWWINGMSSTVYVGNQWRWDLARRGRWNVRGYGNVPYRQRYWVNVRRTNGNCWAN